MQKIVPSAEVLTRKSLTNVLCDVVGCGRCFKHTSALHFHKVKVHKIIENDSDKKLIWNGNKNKSSIVKHYHCPFLDCHYSLTHKSPRSFSAFRLLKQHYCSVHQERKFVCEECKDKFSRKGDLIRHKKTCTFHGRALSVIGMLDQTQHQLHCAIANVISSPSTLIKKKFKRNKEDVEKKKTGWIPIQPKKASVNPCYILLLPNLATINNTSFLNGNNNNNTILKENNIAVINKNNINIKSSLRNNIIKKKKMVNKINKETIINKTTTPLSHIPSSSSSFSSSSSPLCKAVEIQTVGVTRTKKKSQGSQVVTKQKKVCLKTEHNQTQTIPIPASYSTTFKFDVLSQPPSSSSSLTTSSSLLTTSSSSFWNPMPKIQNSFSDCQTQTLFLEKSPENVEDFGGNDNMVTSNIDNFQVFNDLIMLNNTINNTHNKTFNDENNNRHISKFNDSISTESRNIDNSLNSYSNNFGNNTQTKRYSTVTSIINTASQMTFTNNKQTASVQTPAMQENKSEEIHYPQLYSIDYNSLFNGNVNNGDINRNNIMNSITINSNNRNYPHINNSEVIFADQQYAPKPPINNSAETQTSFSWGMDDFQYISDHFLSHDDIPTDCLTSTETQTIENDLPDWSDIYDLLDTTDITTQTPLFNHFHLTEEAHTQTSELDFTFENNSIFK